MRRLLIVPIPILLLVLISQLSGCIDPNGVPTELLKEHQSRLVMKEEPEEGQQTVADVRIALLGVSEEPHDHDHSEADHSDHDHEAEIEAGHEHGEEVTGHDVEADEQAGHDHEASDDLAEHVHDEEEHADHDHEAEEHANHDHEHADHDESDHDHVSLPTEPIEVLMVGTVGGLSNPWEEMQPDYPFADGQAMLFVCNSETVAEKEATGHVHAPGEECAFCARHAADTSNMVATVRFLDEQGKVIRIPAQKLFDVKPMDTVVVKGTARVNKGGLLIVDAEELYVRK